jgi:hypothetical protein
MGFQWPLIGDAYGMWGNVGDAWLLINLFFISETAGCEVQVDPHMFSTGIKHYIAGNTCGFNIYNEK